MYSVVLMSALTAGSASEGWFLRGCHGCSGCQGCHGFMVIRGNFCSGCTGCSGCSCSCAGCHGCSGYAGYGHYSGWGAYAGWAHYAPFGCYGCYGCYGGYSCYGSPMAGHGYWVEPEGSGKKGGPEEAPAPKKKKKAEDEVRYENRARVIVDLPEDARLYIDGTPMTTTSGRRVFQTPDLVKGHTYYYELKSEVIRSGRPIVQTRTVLLRAGETATANFLATESASARTGD